MWTGLSVGNQGVVWFLDECLREHERVAGSLVDLSDGKTLLLFSDYTGEQSQARFSCLTYFVTNEVEALKWDEWRLQIRAQFGLSDRRMGYSRLNDKRRAAAAPAFAEAANQLRGFVVSVLIDKRIRSFFKRDALDQSRNIGGESAEHWRPRVFERMARVTQLAAFFAAGASSPGQRGIWITDEDELAPSVERFGQVTSAFANALLRYAPHPVGPIRFGTTASDSGALELEDLAAVPDLFAGAITEFASAHREFGFASTRERPIVTERAKRVGGALFDPEGQLRKVIFVAQPIDGSTIFSSTSSARLRRSVQRRKARKSGRLTSHCSRRRSVRWRGAEAPFSSREHGVTPLADAARRLDVSCGKRRAALPLGYGGLAAAE